MRLRTLVELVRAPAALSVPGDVVAGAGATRVLSGRTAGLACSSVCLYWAGMAANDWADRDLDAVERPERPIPSGRISPRAALGVALGLTAAGLATAAAAGGRRSLAVAVPLAVAVWGYDLRLKNTAAGPLGMAVCRALDVLLGASPARRPDRAWRAALAVAVHTCTVTALSRREVSGADPRLAATTLATTSVLTAAVVATRADSYRCAEQRRAEGTLSGDSARYPARRQLASAVAGVLAAGYALRYGRAQSEVLRDPSAPRVRAAVGAGITSLPSLQGALTAQAGAPWAGLAVAAAAPVAKRLAKQVSPT